MTLRPDHLKLCPTPKISNMWRVYLSGKHRGLSKRWPCILGEGTNQNLFDQSLLGKCPAAAVSSGYCLEGTSVLGPHCPTPFPQSCVHLLSLHPQPLSQRDSHASLILQWACPLRAPIHGLWQWDFTGVQRKEILRERYKKQKTPLECKHERAARETRNNT